MFRAILLSVLLMFSLHHLTDAARTQDIYFDSEYTSSKSDGSSTSPYKDLLPLLNIFKVTTVATEINVYLKPRSQPYSMKTDPATTIKNKFITNLTITSWSGQDGLEESLPIINGTGLYLALDSIPFVNFTGVKFIEMNGAIQINMAQKVFMVDLCIDDESSMSKGFFSIRETENFIMQHVIVATGNATEIISYSNSKLTKSVVNIEDLLISFSADSMRENNNEVSSFRFISSMSEESRLSVNKIQLKNKGSTMFSQVFEITKFSTVDLKGLEFREQEVQISGKNGVFVLKDIKTMTLENTSISNNTIDIQDKVSLFCLKNMANLNLLDTRISDNVISGRSRSHSLKILQIDGGVSSIIVNNVDVFKNKYSILVEMINILNEALGSTSLNFENISLDSNRAENHNNFNLLKFVGGKIQDFQAQNITTSNNSFSGKIFDIVAIGDVTLTSQDLDDITIQHTLLKFTDISIINNENLVNFGLLSLSSQNPSLLPSDYVPDYEYYSVVMQNLTIENNAFVKGHQNIGLTVDKLSVIQIAGAQLSIEDSRLASNNFTSFSFASLYRVLSSVFFVNSTVDNTNFTEAHFLITKYESLVINQGSFFGSVNEKEKTVEAIYRYAFVLDSNFTNMQIQEGSLFTFHNGFLLIENNKFDSIAFIKSPLLKAGRFHAPGSDISGVEFVRNEKVELDSLILNQKFVEAYYEMIEQYSSFGDDNIYYYTMSQNHLSNLKIYGKSLINFEDYESQQSSICLTMNEFSGFEFPDIVTDIIKLSGSLKAFYFFGNFLDDLYGAGSILRFSSLEENEIFDFTKNIITNNQGPSILTASGTELSDITIAYNQILNNTFINTVFTLDMILHKNTIVLLENLFQNNTLLVGDEDLNTMNSFIKVSSEASDENTQFIFQRCEFIQNTYSNTRLFNQYAHLNAMINLLIANSSLLIQDNIFQDIQMINQGRDLFYLL